jgi:hypothetical protein
MEDRTISFGEVGLIAGTRALGGVGLGLLIANKIGEDRRKAIGMALLGLGILTTVPLLYDVISKKGMPKFLSKFRSEVQPQLH